jgi:hypothetical protein
MGHRRINYPPPTPPRPANPFVQYASDMEKAAERLRHALNKDQAVDCLRSVRHFLEIAEAAIK